MALLTAEIHVTLKDLVLDPQGTTLKRSLDSLGFPGVEEVRMGKYIQVRFASDDRRAVEEQVREMCQRILSNPVIEQYRYTITEGR
jgi:phosphoribosylformylglycinamidine synthase